MTNLVGVLMVASGIKGEPFHFGVALRNADGMISVWRFFHNAGVGGARGVHRAGLARTGLDWPELAAGRWLGDLDGGARSCIILVPPPSARLKLSIVNS